MAKRKNIFDVLSNGVWCTACMNWHYPKRDKLALQETINYFGKIGIAVSHEKGN